MTRNETENFEAFDLVACALEELDLHEASIKAQAAREDKDSRKSKSANREELTPAAKQALDNARRYLNEALNKNPDTAAEGTDEQNDRTPKGDEDYFKAHYLLAMTDYFSGQAGDAAILFERILDLPAASDKNAHPVSRNAHANADKGFLDEVRYNLGAAYFEQRKFKDAIAEFDRVITATEKRDVALELLARSAKALAHARRWQESGSNDDSDQAETEVSMIKKRLRKDWIFLYRIGWRDGLIIRKRKVDQRTDQSIRQILEEVKNELSGKRGPEKVAGHS